MPVSIFAFPSLLGPAFGESRKFRQGILALAGILFTIQVAHAICLAVTGSRVGTVYPGFAKHD